MASHRPRFVADWRTRKTHAEARRGEAWYRRRVVVLKFVLPVLALGLLLSVGIWPSLFNTAAGFRVGFSDLDFALSGRDEMVNPRFYGVDENNQPYTVTAEVAMRTTATAEQVFLMMPEADIVVSEEETMVVRADQGVYDPESETLKLDGGVSLYSDQGYEFHTEQALLDLASGQASGEVPIHGQGPWGLLDAVGFTYWREEQRFLFRGRPTLVLYPDAEEDG